MLELTAVEARVLGSLIEKGSTTPDYYPMTLNSLTSACNQASNRDPVSDYSQGEVADAMRSLREKDLARSVRTSGSRTMKHRHDIENLLVIDNAAASLLAVMMLRGPQTTGELRIRTERYHDFESLDAVEKELRTMAEDDPALVLQLDRQPGQKEARWVQLLTTDGTMAPSPPAPVENQISAPVAPTPQPVDNALENRVAALEARVAELEQQLGL